MVYNVHEIFRRSRIVRTTGIFFQYQDLKSRFVSWIFFSPVPGFEILVPGIFYCMADKSVLKKPNLCPLEGGVCFAPRTFPHPKHITFHNIYCGNRASHPTLALLFSQHFVWKFCILTKLEILRFCQFAKYFCTFQHSFFLYYYILFLVYLVRPD